MERKLNNLTNKRKLCRKIDIIAKLLITFSICLLVCSMIFLLNLMYPFKYKDIYDSFIPVILIGMVITFICTLNSKIKDLGKRVLRNEYNTSKYTLVAALVVVVITLIARPILPQLFYMGISILCVSSVSFSLMAYKIRKSNIEYFNNQNGYKDVSTN